MFIIQSLSSETQLTRRNGNSEDEALVAVCLLFIKKLTDIRKTISDLYLVFVPKLCAY